MAERIVNFDDPRETARVLSYVRTLKGRYLIKIVKARRTRSLRQNAYMWGVVIPYIAAGLEEAWGEKLSNDETHEFLKARFLSRPVVNHKTGEITGHTIGSSARQNTQEFSEHLEQICKFAAENLGVVIPPSDADLFLTKGQDHGKRG